MRKRLASVIAVLFVLALIGCSLDGSESPWTNNYLGLGGGCG